MQKPAFYEKLPVNTVPIIMQGYKNHTSISFHWHEKIEILYFARGGGKVRCNESIYSVKAGDIIFVNANETHAGIDFEKNTKHYFFHLNTDFFNTIIDNKFVLIENLITDEYCKNLIENMILEFSEKKFGFEIAIKRDMFAFLTHVLRNYVKIEVEATKAHSYFKTREKLHNILIYINSHYDENLSVESLAENFYTSSSYFAHFFKKHTKKSVMEYVNDVRIEKAKILLAKGEIPITDIACKVGYNDINYFSRKFRQKTGLTPSKYKKMIE